MQPETLFPKGNATGFYPSKDWQACMRGLHTLETTQAEDSEG